MTAEAFENLKNLSEWEVLGGRCAGCGPVSWLDKKAIERQIGNQYLLNLRGKLRCSCGNRIGNEVLIERIDRNA